MTRDSLDGVEELTSLLGEQNGHGPKPAERGLLSRLGKLQVRKPRTVVFLVSTIKFVVTMSSVVIMLPAFRLMEDAFCHRYYNDDSRDLIDERKCKVDEVQRELAYLSGWFAMVNAVVGLLVAMPYGVLADRVGRKPIILLSYTGLTLSFFYGPTLIWFGRGLNLYLLLSGSLFFLIGGGVATAMSVLYAMAADVSNEKDRAASFLYLALGSSAGALLGPILSGKLMESFGPWVPILLSWSTVPFVFLMLSLLPETLKVEAKVATGDDLPVLVAMRKHVVETGGQLVQALTLIRNINILLSLSAFFVQNPLIVAYTSILAQYVSKRFGWTLAQTSYLLSPLSIIHILVLALLPKISEILVAPNRSFRWSSFVKDVRLAQLSFALLTLAALMEGFSQEIVLFLAGLLVGTFGAATSPLCRAIITEYVDAERTSRLYALISIVETVGAMFGGPVLAWCFDAGMRKQGLWIGLPYFYIALLCSLVFAALSVLKEPRRSREDGEAEGHPDAPIGEEL